MNHRRASRNAAPSSLLALFRRLALESPAQLAISSLGAVMQSVVLIPIALLVRDLFDTAIPRRDTGSIVLMGAAILALYAAAAAFGFVARAAALRTATRIVNRLRLELLVKLHSLPQDWHDRQRVAAVQSIVAQDTERVEAMLATVAGNLLPAVVAGAALLLAALVISPILFLTSVVVVPPLVFAGLVLARRARAMAAEWSESSRRFSGLSQLLLRALVTTRIVGGEPWAIRRGGEQATELSERHRQLGMAAAVLSAVENAIGAAAATAVLVVGGIEVAHHTMKLGDLLAFYAVLGLLLRQVYSVGWQSNTVVIGLQSLHDVDAVLTIDRVEPYARGRRKLEFRGGVSLLEVSFSYTDEPVLRELSLTIAPGEHLALIGPNGAGKSTLVNLLLALYEPDSGLVWADGIQYSDLDIKSLRRQIGVVLQDPVLLPGTIRENIAYARPDVTDAAVRAAAHAATAADFIEVLPEGYATMIGDEGTGLSGGQRQRIAIARALLGAPALLVLDEPSTYLDDPAVSTLMSRVMALPHAPTVILVTHDAQVAAHVERVIELRAGRVVRDSRSRPSIGVARA